MRKEGESKILKRHLILLIIASIAIILAITPVTQWAYKTFYLDPALAGTPEDAVKWADPYTYEETWYSISRPIIGGTTLCILWGLALSKTRQKPRNATLRVILLVILCVPLWWINITPVQATPASNKNLVDVLCIGDQIFSNQPEWITNAEHVLDDVNARNFVSRGIRFMIRGWQVWNATSGLNDMYYLLQEAIYESGMDIRETEYGWGLIPGSPYTDNEGYVWLIDLLLIFSYQGTMRGLSVPQLNATIIHYDDVNLRVLSHELGHQYYLNHCSDTCVMASPPSSDYFCWTHKEELESARDKWVTDTETLNLMKAGSGDGELFITHNPSDNDYCDSLSPFEGEWHAGAAGMRKAADYNNYVVKSESIRFTQTLSSTGFAEAEWHSNAGYFLNLNKYPVISFWTKLESGFTGWIEISVQEGVSPWSWATRQVYAVNDNSWHKLEVSAGSEHEDEWTPEGGSMPDWQNIKWVYWRWWGTNGNAWLDGFFYEIDYSKWYSGAGTYEELRNDEVVICAAANDGHDFAFWVLDGEENYDNPITVTMDSDHDLTAYFEEESGGGGGGGGGGFPLFTPDDRSILDV